MTGFTEMPSAAIPADLKRRTSREGFYTVEAAIFLPLVILAVLTIGYFVRTDSVWEDVMHGALDECSYSAATCSSGPLGYAARKRVEQRIGEDHPSLTSLKVVGSKQTCHISGTIPMSLPLDFGGDYKLTGRIKYRDFIGYEGTSAGMGADALESDVISEPVWIFPQDGECYHSENCTYVKAAVHSCILTDSLKKKYSDCELCNSKDVETGSIVFCFNGEDTAYHRGRCRSIKRHTVRIDKSEAISRGYRACSKCGGS